MPVGHPGCEPFTTGGCTASCDIHDGRSAAQNDLRNVGLDIAYDVIVTFNESHLRDARKSFGIEVIRPAEALRRIKK